MSHEETKRFLKYVQYQVTLSLSLISNQEAPTRVSLLGVPLFPLSLNRFTPRSLSCRFLPAVSLPGVVVHLPATTSGGSQLS